MSRCASISVCILTSLYSGLRCRYACHHSHLVWCVGLIVYRLFMGNIPISRLYLVHYFSYLTHRVGFADIFVLLDQFLGLGCAAWISELWDALLPLPVQTGELVQWVANSWVGIWWPEANACASLAGLYLSLIVYPRCCCKIWAAEVSLWNSTLSCWQRFLPQPWESDRFSISLVRVGIDTITHLFGELAGEAQVLAGVRAVERIWVWEFLLVVWVTVVDLACVSGGVVLAITTGDGHLRVVQYSFCFFDLWCTHNVLHQGISLFDREVLCAWASDLTWSWSGILDIATKLAVLEHFVLGIDAILGLQFALETLCWAGIVFGWMWTMLNSLALVLLRLAGVWSSDDVLPMGIDPESNFWWHGVHVPADVGAAASCTWGSHRASSSSDEVPLRLIVDQVEVFTADACGLLTRFESGLVCSQPQGDTVINAADAHELVWAKVIGGESTLLDECWWLFVIFSFLSRNEFSTFADPWRKLLMRHWHFSKIRAEIVTQVVLCARLLGPERESVSDLWRMFDLICAASLILFVGQYLYLFSWWYNDLSNWDIVLICFGDIVLALLSLISSIIEPGRFRANQRCVDGLLALLVGQINYLVFLFSLSKPLLMVVVNATMIFIWLHTTVILPFLVFIGQVLRLLISQSRQQLELLRPDMPWSW